MSRPMKNTDKFVIVTGGEYSTEKIDISVFKDSFIIAADSGYDSAKKLNIIPDLLVGDMDSISELPKETEILRVKPEKDDTDTMLALGIAKERGAREIIIVGGTGGRIDHLLSNLFMLEALETEGIKAKLYDGENLISVLINGSQTIPHGVKYFGVIALEDSRVTITGCKYPLKDAPLKRTYPYAVSNEVTDDFARVTVSGRAIVSVTVK